MFQHRLKLKVLVMTILAIGSQLCGLSAAHAQHGAPPTVDSLADGDLVTVPPLRFTPCGRMTAAYRINVPEGARELRIAMFGGGGDADLYAAFGAPATTASEYRSLGSRNEEEIIIENPEAGDWYILAYPYRPAFRAMLTATVGRSESTVETIHMPRIIRRQSEFEEIQVPDNVAFMEISLLGGIGDASLFLGGPDLGSPGPAFADFASTNSDTNEEMIRVEAPRQGRWTIATFAERFCRDLLLTVRFGPELRELQSDETTFLDVADGDRQLFRFNVPRRTSFFDLFMFDLNGEARAYLAQGRIPTPDDYDRVISLDYLEVTEPEPGDWYLLVTTPALFEVTEITLTLGAPEPPPTFPLAEGVARPISGDQFSEQLFTIEVPESVDRMIVTLDEGSGDADAYIQHQSPPTIEDHTHALYRGELTVNAPRSGEWFILVYGDADFSSARLRVDFVLDQNEPPPIAGDCDVDNLSGPAGFDCYFTIDIDPDVTELTIRLQGGTGDADLYVRRGSQPTTSNFDYQSVGGTNSETITISSPGSGTWHIMVYGYEAFSGARLSANTETAPPPSSFSPDVSIDAVLRFNTAVNQRTWDFDVYIRHGETEREIRFNDFDNIVIDGIPRQHLLNLRDPLIPPFREEQHDFDITEPAIPESFAGRTVDIEFDIVFWIDGREVIKSYSATGVRLQ